MSMPTSPSSRPPRPSFGIEYEPEADFDPDYTTEISNKMRVPKNIRMGAPASDGSDTEDANIWRYNGDGHEKMRMQVPDRIVVRGQDQHVGTKALPREMQLDADIMPQDHEAVRIQTPPRSITLMNPPFANQNGFNSQKSSEGDDETLIVENNRARFITPEGIPNGPMRAMGISDSFYSRNREGSIGPGGDFEELQSEVDHLREQLGRVTRRMMTVENEMSDRKDRETYIIAAGILYITIQAFSWIFRSQHR